MNKDAITQAFCRLKAHNLDALTLLLEAAAQLPVLQRAAYVREVKAVAKLYAELRPEKVQVERPAPEERKTRMTYKERTAWRRYARDFPSRLAAMRSC